VVKENITRDDDSLVDDVDSSLTRSRLRHEELFAEAGLTIQLCKPQPRWNRDMFPVRVWVLTPQQSSQAGQESVIG
jgi:AdoMet dependent proline di-methyltransferase